MASGEATRGEGKESRKGLENKVPCGKFLRELKYEVPYHVANPLLSSQHVIHEMLPHNNEGMKYSELIRFSFKYPPLLFPVLDFQKMWRRKMFGERFWSERVAEPHSRPTAYEDARSKFGIPSEDFNLFARIPTTKAAWRHTAKNITLDLMANMSSTKTPPPWEQVSKPIARTVLKNHFGYQKAYFFIELLDMRDEAQIEEIERVKASALEKGMFCYDEWLKADFFHNPITGISEVRGQRGVKGEGEGEGEGDDNSNPLRTQHITVGQRLQSRRYIWHQFQYGHANGTHRGLWKRRSWNPQEEEGKC